MGAALALSIISVIAMTSAAATLNPALAWRQAVWVVVGIGVCVVMAQIPYTRWTQGGGIAYGVSVALLAFVLLGGTTRLGATRWISLFGLSVQPVELAKLMIIWWLASSLAGQPPPLSTRSVLMTLAMVGLPALLVFHQPDLGSATILLAIWCGMAWIGGLSRRHLMRLGVCVIGLLPVLWHLLRPYQRDRLLVFVNPHADPLGTGYTVIQSQIAIGSGQWMGRGWFAGTQNQLNFLPERHSDFLFSVIGEEWGLLGALCVMGAFGVLLSRILGIAQHSLNPHGRLLAVGVFSWLAYQAFVNIGMVIGVLPVVGMPLPLLSYGGSSMVAVWAAVGLMQRIHLASHSTRHPVT